MTPERWKEIYGHVKDNFEVEDEGNLELEDNKEKEFIIFTTPMGKIKLEFLIQPLVLDKKTTYSQRVGSEVKVDYVLSDTEKTYKMKTFKWDMAIDDWQEIDSSMFT